MATTIHERTKMKGGTAQNRLHQIF
ncbi:uncharacterized protein METZ01_LOCUS442544 [marine metagenome]|uniref:Uncharacterized protein n=1 Tax=marine metagenome TaxID=408172 RepID=A0A382Z304_9ZZZZ